MNRRIALLTIAALAGCGGEITDTGATGLPGQFELTSYEGKTPPFIYNVIVSIPADGGAGFNCNNLVVSEQRTFTADSARVVTQGRWECTDPKYNKVFADSTRGAVTIVGSDVTITFPAVGGGTTIEHAQLSGNTLAVSTIVSKPASPLFATETSFTQRTYRRTTR